MCWFAVVLALKEEVKPLPGPRSGGSAATLTFPSPTTIPSAVAEAPRSVRPLVLKVVHSVRKQAAGPPS